MDEVAQGEGWRFFRFGLIVTGEGEELFLPDLFRALTVSGHCHFHVLRRIGQRSAVTSVKQQLKMVGAGKIDEKRDGANIVGSLDVDHVLARPHTCASLRVLFAWCSAAMGNAPSERFCLNSGVYDVVTGPQLAALPAPPA